MASALPVATAVLAAALALAAPRAAAEGGAIAVPDAPRQRELLALLHQDCGSCHGLRLTGGLGPPLTSEALQAKPEASLVATIVSGRPGTAMPPWRRFVSESEARWLVARMVAGATRER